MSTRLASRRVTKTSVRNRPLQNTLKKTSRSHNTTLHQGLPTLGPQGTRRPASRLFDQTMIISFLKSVKKSFQCVLVVQKMLILIGLVIILLSSLQRKTLDIQIRYHFKKGTLCKVSPGPITSISVLYFLQTIHNLGFFATTITTVSNQIIQGNILLNIYWIIQWRVITKTRTIFKTSWAAMYTHLHRTNSLAVTQRRTNSGPHNVPAQTRILIRYCVYLLPSLLLLYTGQ